MAPLSARTAVEELLKALPAGQPLDARIVLAAHPELNGHRSEILDLIYEEYCRRVEAGESIAPAEFAARFPSLSRSLLRLFDVHRLLVEGKKLFQPDFDLDWPKPGELWLNFQLLEEIGRGAFSRVYVAREALLGNRLAVVKATPLGPREAEMLGKLGHLHVVPVFSVQRDEELDLSAVCMPFLSRATLLDVMDAVFSGKPPTRAAAILDVVRQINSPTSRIEPVVEEECHWSRRWSYVEGVLHIGIQIAEALNHAHRLGILHCDVKPSNVLLTNHGRAILLDFNLSRLQGGGTPFCGGTLPYMSPEQLSVLLPEERSQPGEAGVPSDVFSFGVTLFEILCGRNPFGALRSSSTRLDAARELLQRQRRGLCPYDIESAGIDRRVAAIIGRCLEFESCQRPQSMDEVCQLLRGQLQLSQRSWRWLRSHRRSLASVSLLVVVAGLSLGACLSMRDPYPVREFRAGRRAYEGGQHAVAVQHLSAALQNDPRFIDAQLLRGFARLHQKDFVGAYADFEALTEQLPDGRATAGLAQVYAVLRAEFRQAAVIYQRAVDEGCRTAAVYNNLGFCLFTDGQLPEAAEALKKASTLAPDLSAPYHNLARVELLTSLQEVRVPDVGAVEKALRLGPETAELYMDAASLYAARGRPSSDGRDNQAVSRTFELLGKAVDCGLTRDHLAAVASLDETLKSDKRWHDLDSRARTGPAVSPAVLLIDLMPELLTTAPTQARAVAKR